MVSVTVLPRSRPLTSDDLALLPDDGHRYELVDGTLVVSPAPSVEHQRVIGNLYLLLRSTCPPDLEVFLGPIDVVLAEDTVMQPDLLVVRRSDLTSSKNIPAVPVLAVEVASPSTRLVDRTLKRARLEAAGCPHFWIVDPLFPAVTAWRLVDGAYEEVLDAGGDERVTLDAPYPLDFTPESLAR